MLALSIALAAPPSLPRLTPIADGVYTYEQSDPTKRGVTVHNLIVVTAEGVLVADGQGTVENTKRLVDDIATLTPQPIRYVVVGSVHGDHRGGDAGFPAGVTIVKEAKAITLGGRRIEVLFLGRAHTGSDLEVYLPAEKILYMSEAFSNGIFPSMSNAFPSEWVAALKKAEAMDVDKYIPAHGTVDGAMLLTGRDDLRAYRTAIETVIAEGRRLHDAHVAVDEAPQRAQFGALARLPRYSDNAAGALKRVYMDLDGQLPARQ